ncbi:MAG: NAD+ synthase [Ilumatobacteraceae bacterium]|nr:NAD+ synthase [Ilumatobacteraceae bacterium]
MANLRIGLAQLNPTVGDLAGNRVLIIDAYRRAVDAGCDLVAFPELSITGYPPEDLVLKPGFVRDNRAVLQELAALTTRCVAVIGFVDVGHGHDPGSGRPRLHNAAAVCANGAVKSIHHKRLLPNYDVFDEERTFEPGRGDHRLIEVGGVKVGVSICEDIWHPDGPVSEQAALGARVNVNINGSPFHVGKLAERERMLAQRARDNSCAIVYVNQVGGQDELIFDGASMVFDARGNLLARSPQFVSDLMVVDVDLDSPKPTIVAPITDRAEELYGALVSGTRDYVRKNKFTDVVIGLSGGIDSSLVAAVAVDALGADHVHGVSMPSRYSSEGSKTDAHELAAALGIDIRTISIEPVFQSYLDVLGPSFEGRDPDLTEENLQSRCRGQILMALSNKFGWMVLTTGNKSEMAVGYFTIYGDSVGGYAVIKDVLKLDVFAISRHVNERAGRVIIPESVLTKPPSAELRPDQRDDQSLPPYEILDPILSLYVEQDRTASEIIELGHPEDVVRRIARLVDLNEYKRRQCPPGVRVSEKAFGKDRRLPITNGYRG